MDFFEVLFDVFYVRFYGIYFNVFYRLFFRFVKIMLYFIYICFTMSVFCRAWYGIVFIFVVVRDMFVW